MVKHYNISVKGKVQGVFYRDSTRKKALEFNIKGFVKNLPDGSVYIEAEGNETNLKSLVSWCHSGPARAKVETVITEETEIKGFEKFEILQ